MPIFPALLIAFTLWAGHSAPSAADDPVVTWMAHGRSTVVNVANAEERHHTFRILIIGIAKLFMAIDKAHSALRVTDGSPEFRIALSPGAEQELLKRPQFVVLVRLTSNDGVREVRFSRNEEKPFSKDDVIPFTLGPGTTESPTSAVIHRAIVTGKLNPGEYAFVIDGKFYDFGVN